MAKFDYGKMRNTAARLLNRFAQGTVQLKRVTEGTPNPELGEPPLPGTTTLITIDVTVARVSQAFSKNTLVIERGDILTISPTGRDAAGASVDIDLQEENVNLSIVIDGDERSITEVKRIPGAGTIVCWKAKVSD